MHFRVTFFKGSMNTETHVGVIDGYILEEKLCLHVCDFNDLIDYNCVLRFPDKFMF